MAMMEGAGQCLPCKTRRIRQHHLLILDPSGGANQIRVRAHNERLVLSLVRRHGALSKAEIARRSGLSAQTVSVIMRALEKDGLLSRGEPVRGRVGQPSIPMRLNPDAVLSFGVKIGRRSADLVLMDFVGRIRMQLHQIYAYPLPQDILSFVTSGIQELEKQLSGEERRRIAGVGIAAPFELWNWAEEVGAPKGRWRPGAASTCRRRLLRGYPISSICRTTPPAPAGPSSSSASARAIRISSIFFIGSFIGGGIVLNSSIFVGRTGTAGALGPLPVRGRNGETRQLLDIASIYRVWKIYLREAGIDPAPLWYSADDWIDFGAPLEIWIQDTAKALAQAIVAAASIIDFSAAVIDGGFPGWVRERVVRATVKAASELDLQGVVMPEIIEGAVGPQARAIGGASLPIFARYLIDQNVLFKEIDHAEGH